MPSGFFKLNNIPHYHSMLPIFHLLNITDSLSLSNKIKSNTASTYIEHCNWNDHRWITYLVPNTTSPDATDVASGRDRADGRGVGKLFLTGVPIGVEVAIGTPPGVWLTVDCCGVIPDNRGLFTRPLVSTLDWGTSDSLSRKLTNNSENDWKQATV